MQRRQIIVDNEIAIFNLCLFGPGCRVSISLSVHATLVSEGMQTGTSLHSDLILFGCSLIQVQRWGHAHQVKEPACGFYRRLYGQDTVGVSCLSPNEWS